MTTLVLLPGLDGTGLLFADFVSALGPEFEIRVFIYPEGPFTSYEDLEAAARLLLPTDRPFIILAESFAGPVGISLAASAPPGLAGLILCCTFACDPQPFLARIAAGLLTIPHWLMRAFVDLRSRFVRFSSSRMRSALREVHRIVPPAIFRSRLRALGTIDVSEKLRRVRVPILYLRATKDWVVPGRCCDHILRIAPQTQVVRFEAQHLLLQTEPDRAAQAVTEFARSVASSREERDRKN